MASITCGNCKAKHSSVAEVKACYGIGVVGIKGHAAAHKAAAKGTHVPTGNVAKVTASASTATDKQQAFIVKLWGERYPETSEAAMAAVREAAAKLTKAEASEQIGQLLALPKGKAATATAPSQSTDYMAEAKKGDVHFVDGAYYRIHVGQTSGKPYACRAYISGEAQWAEDGSLVKAASVRWDRVKGMIFKLSNDTKATPEQAAAFGKLVGRCCFCSHQIDTPESTAAGYGPVCASNYGLPWGDTTTVMEASA